MRLDDLDAVMTIEGSSFLTPWPRSGYEHELTRNEHAHYHVLLGPDEQIVGYGGQWLVAGEGHISIMAIDPAWRGHGLGELLLSSLIQQAEEGGAERVLLEVRTSNLTAQALYQKYQFEEVGRRPHYYHDTGEDALLMTLELNRPGVPDILRQNRAALQARLAAGDEEEE